MEAKEITKALNCFQGTFQYYEHKMPNDLKLLLTDGCDFLRKECEAYWLFDSVLSFQLNQNIRETKFQVWKIRKQDDNTYFLSCEDGNKDVLAAQHIEFSDFPLEEVTIFLVDGVAMLPSEY